MDATRVSSQFEIFDVDGAALEPGPRRGSEVKLALLGVNEELTQLEIDEGLARVLPLATHGQLSRQSPSVVQLGLRGDGE